MNDIKIEKIYYQFVDKVKRTKKKKEAEELLFSGDWVLIMQNKLNNGDVEFVLAKLRAE